MSDRGRSHDSVVLVDQSGRVLFRRGFEGSQLQQSTELSLGHKLLPKIDELADQDIPKLLPVSVEAKGIERLKLEGVSRGGCLVPKKPEHTAIPKA